MKDMAQLWREYARLQKALDDCNVVDSKTWGREAGLTYLLQSPTELTCDDVDRIVRSAGRRERHRRALRRIYGHESAGAAGPDQLMQVCQDAERARKSATGSDWPALVAIAVGYGYPDVARRYSLTAGALRVRVSRLRRRMSELPDVA